MRVSRPVLVALSFLAVLLLAVVLTHPVVAEALKDVVIVNPPSQPVQVGNGSSNALWVRSADAGTPYNFEGVAGIAPGFTSGDVVLAVVQAGHELVIDHVSAGADLPPGERARAVLFARDQGSTFGLWDHQIVMTDLGQGFVVGDARTFAGGEAMHIRVKGTAAGTEIGVRVIRTTSSETTVRGAGFSATLSGYTVP